MLVDTKLTLEEELEEMRVLIEDEEASKTNRKMLIKTDIENFAATVAEYKKKIENDTETLKSYVKLLVERNQNLEDAKMELESRLSNK